MTDRARVDATLADQVAAITADAAALALASFRTDVTRWEKAPGDPVSEVDLAVDRYLRERLGGLLPDAGWLSEETVDDPARLACERVWIVDPIDGTRDFLRGRTGWAVSVALVEHGRPVLGVLDAPALGRRWRAVLDEGAERDGVALRAGACSALAGARVPIDQLPSAEGDLVAVAKPNSIALRIAMIAADEADVLATFRWGHEWDLAAVALIATEAGATVTDALGEPLMFNTPRASAFGVLAAAPGVHAAAVARWRERAMALRDR